MRNEFDFLKLDNNTSSFVEFDSRGYLGENYNNSGYMIDLPQVQGAIYAETCISCRISYQDASDGCSFCSQIDFTSIQISENTFQDNQDGFLFYKAHDFKRAS